MSGLDGALRGAAFLDAAAPHSGPLAGLDSAPERLPHATHKNAPKADSGGAQWPEPQPLIAKVGAEPYPLDALPKTVREAVQEVQGFTKAPVALVACSALAALSVAIQSLADVKRAERLIGPSSLYLLAIADSGERKTTCDGYFTKAIRDHEAEQAELAKPLVTDYRAALNVWEAKHGGIKDAIRSATKARKPTGELINDLRDLEHEKPEPPRVPRLIYGDATPEALKWNLAKGWPSGGVISSEAGIVFGSHGMGKDSVMRNLATLNELWDGKDIATERRTSESFTVRGARLTVALQVQEATIQSFFDRSGALARGTGFLARFLVAWPESTQGTRLFTEAPTSWPALAAFNRRLAALLAAPVSMVDGALSPPVMPLEDTAKTLWVAFHDAIERELATGGELHDVRDVASKTADNAARLAALFQVFEHHEGGAIGADALESATRVAAWHLNEARRFFGELALPKELANAARLDAWLIAYCLRERTHFVPVKKVQQYGPGSVREKVALEAAARELAELGRATLVEQGRKRVIQVNPALLIAEGAV